MDELERIEQKYGFILPEDYRSMQARGWFETLPSDDPRFLWSPGSEWFWLPGTEWMPLNEILSYEPEDYEKPGFVPFAATGSGDYWCWWPADHPEVVVFCTHDDELGEFFAPSFTGFIYRRLLEHAQYVSADSEQATRHCLQDNAARLSGDWPSLWVETLTEIASAELVPQFAPNGNAAGVGLMTQEQYQAILQRDLAFSLLHKVFQWMNPPRPKSGESADTLALRKIIDEADHRLTHNELRAALNAEVARQKGKL